MFKEACKRLGSTVLPILCAWRLRRGKEQWGIGAGMFVNRDGWFVTAGHILNQIQTMHLETTKTRRREKKDDITDFMFTVGTRRVEGTFTAKVNPAIDLGIGKVDDIVPPDGYQFPRFRGDVEIGELLCRIGFPFVAEEHGFELKNVFPVPMFANEAFVSRFNGFKTESGQMVGTWIETSSPGLRGQSGGPLVDPQGNVCGIQVNTKSYPLNFKGVGSNQALHVGRAVHGDSIRRAFEEWKIPYLRSEEGEEND